MVWRNNLGKTLADVPPDAPRRIEARAVGSTSIQVTWDPSNHTSSYTVQRRQLGGNFTTIASNVTNTTFTDNTAVTNTTYEYLLLAQNTHGMSPPSRVAQATANQSNLTVFRPQSFQDPDSPVDAPIYRPFPKAEVRDQDETSNTLGPGIRINHDDDNENGTRDAFESGNEIEMENDLIEVRVDRLPGQGNLVLVAQQPLALYYNHDKQTPIPLNAAMTATEPLPFVNNTITIFVEWQSSAHGAADLRLVNPATPNVNLDVVRFHSFRSLIIVFGGFSQDPRDGDGNGSIGDPVQGGPNREGVFDLAQGYYDTGWDVMAFDENEVDNSDDVPFREAKAAVQERFVTPQNGGGLALLGYSQGGGAVHDLIERLWDEETIVTWFGVMLDGVDHDGATEENDWPDQVAYLLSIYQQNSLLSGGDIDNDEVEPGFTLEEINTNIRPGWNPNLSHTQIDDDPQVLQWIRFRLEQRLLNR